MPNFVACADLHGRKSAPMHRVDNYFETFCRKLEYTVEYANKHMARMLIAGDIFDSSKCSVEVLNEILRVLNQANYTPYVVPGQHDLLYHTDLKKTPLWNLHLSETIKIIDGHYDIFTGVGFEQEVPEGSNTFLITHKCITKGKPPFFLEDAVSASDYMEAHPEYEYIISGDYHSSHFTEFGKRNKRYLINCGTFMRNKKDMQDHKPCFWFINTDDLEITQVIIPHKPYEEVFNIEAIAYEEEHGITIDTSKLKELIETGGELLELDNIIWNIYKDTNSKLSKPLVKEVLEACK